MPWFRMTRAGLCVALLAALGCLAAQRARAEVVPSDPKAIAIADQVMTALGGRERWDALKGLRWSFEFAVGDTIKSSRRHAWDKQTGWHRVEGVNRSGQPFVLIEQLDGKGGMAWMNHNAIQGDSLAKLMKRAKSLWTNDTYWMLMPYKLRDPGVTLKYAGESKQGAITYDRLALSFDQVGETPGDHYWVFVNRANHRIEKWEFVLQGEKPPAEKWTWEGWEQHDGLWFPTAHRQGANTLYTRNVETVSAFKPAEFKAP
jgi:hypothetical protein